MKILITSGATREPIDAVRFLSNVSTGATGAKLADALSQRGHTVTLLRGEGAVRSAYAREVLVFTSTDDLRQQLQEQLGTGAFDAIIHCAAVSDYRPAEMRGGKISSYEPELILRLVLTPKLLPQLKNFSPRPLNVIGFKLTAGADDTERTAAVEKVFNTGGVDAIIHNDMIELAIGDARPFRVYEAGEDVHGRAPIGGLPELIEWLGGYLPRAAAKADAS